MKYWIFGAGKFGRQCYEIFSNKLDIIGFIDNNKEKNEKTNQENSRVARAAVRAIVWRYTREEREEREERRERVRLARCGLRVRVALCLSGARWVSWTLFRGAA